MKFRTILLIPTLVAAVGIVSIGTASAQSELLTFDDLSGLEASVPNGYGGLQWNNFSSFNTVYYSSFGELSGVNNGVVSLNNVAFSGGGDPASISISAGSFNLNSAYLMAAWNDGLQVEVQGFVGAIMAYDETFTVGTQGSTLINFNYLGVDNINFTSSGGVPHGFSSGGPGPQFGMDNLSVTLFPGTGTGHQDFTYTTNAGQITITSYTGPGGNVTIPSLIEGQPVTSIGSEAFSSQGNLTNLSIPGTVTNIGSGAFNGCANLSSVTIPNGVTVIYDSTFWGCSGLTNVVIPNSVTIIQAAAFIFCTNLTSVTIPNSVFSITDGYWTKGYGEVGAFSSCTSLTNVTLGNGVTNIGADAFRGCTSLSNVTIPEGVVRIGAHAFLACSSLKDVTIPKSVTDIEGELGFSTEGFTSPFAGCTTLTAITVDAMNPAYTSSDGVLFDKSVSTLIEYPGGKAGTYTIPDGVTNIGITAFFDCPRLANVTIGDSVTSMGSYAFASCLSLESVNIGNNVTNIEFGAFYYSTKLSAINVAPLNPAYSSLDGVLFDKSQTSLVQCPQGKAVAYVVPNSVANIEDYAFYSCTNLSSVSIGEGVNNIGNFAFSDCTSLIAVTVGNGVRNIGNSAFSGCTQLMSVSLGNQVTSITAWAFSYCPELTSITIPNSVTNIDWYVFFGDSSLASVIFQGNAPAVGLGVFNGGDKTTVLYLPGTTGWGPTFGDAPTMLWNPQAQTSDASFGVRQGQFGFNITGTPGIPLVVEATTKLAGQSWLPLQSFTLTNGSVYFSDAQWTNISTRFYRIRSP